MKRWMLLLAVGLLMAAQPSRDEAIFKDKEQLQGTWSVVSVVINGKELEVEKLAGAKIIIKGDVATGKVIRLGKDSECTFKIDPTQKVKHFDFIHTDGTVLPGVYSVTSTKLKICFGPPNAPRPSALEAPKGSNLTLISLHRDR